MKRLSLLALSMLLTCTLFAADIFLRGAVNSWGAPDEFKFATSDNVVYTLEKSFDLFGEFKFAGAVWEVGPDYGSAGGAVELETPLTLVNAGGNFNCGANSFKVTKIVLDLSKMTATITGQGGELEITSWTVCGSAAVMGTEFDPTDTSNDMESVGGVYQLQKKGVTLAADAIYGYKFTGNHAWGVGQFPEGMSNLEFTVSADGTYDVTFSWNPATKAYSAIPTSVTPPVVFDSYIVVGDAALFYVDWTPSPIGVEYFTLETTDGIHYTKTVENVPIKTAGTFAYGFSKNGSTTEILFKDKSQTVTVDEAGAYNIAVSLTVAPGEEPVTEAILTKVDPGTTYYIAGNGGDFGTDVDWCCGENWKADKCPMESGYFTRDLPAGEYKFKITDGKWYPEGKNWGYDAVDATQSTAGYTFDDDGNVVFVLTAALSTVGIHFNGTNIVLEWTEKEAPAEFDTWTLVGDDTVLPGWTPIAQFDLQTTDGIIYTASYEDVNITVEEFQYGFRKNHTATDYAPLQEKYTAKMVDGTGSYKVDIKLDFTDATNPDVEVIFEKNVTPTYDYYIAGNGDGENGWTCGETWVANGCGMENGQYIAMVKPGTYEFKITNGYWDDNPAGINWGAGAVDATLSTPGYEGSGNSNVKFTVESDAKISVTFDGEHIVLTSDVPFVSTTVEVWSVVGDAALGLTWDPISTPDDMESVGGAYQLVKTGLSLEAGTPYSYKFTANHKWGVEERPNNGNETLTVTESGTYKVTFYLSATAEQWGATPEKQEDPGFDSWTLVGDKDPFPADWEIIPGFDLQTTDGIVYELHEQTAFSVTEFEYGFRKNHDKTSYAPLEEKYTATLAEGTGEYKVDIRVDFTDATMPTVEVLFTKVPEPTGITVNVEVPDNTPACYFYGGLSHNEFVEMNKVDATHYTVLLKDADMADFDWGFQFVWEAGNWNTKSKHDNYQDQPVDGVINAVVTEWLTDPGVEYHYTQYNDWTVKTDWNGSWDPEFWLILTPNNDGTFSGLGQWGKGSGVNLGSTSGPVKKDWYPADDADLTIEPGLAVGTQVRITLTVISDDQVNIRVEDANPTSADEAAEDSIYATNGTVFCSAPFEIYNLVGQNVTAQNGSLFGIYIVKTANVVKTVSVK